MALLMDSFVTFMDDDSLVGEDSFSVCHEGVDTKSAEASAAKDVRHEAAEQETRREEVDAAEDARHEAAELQRLVFP